MYTLIVGNQEWSSWSLRPYLALSAIGVPFKTEVIKLRVIPDSREAILKHSPAGKVPVLKSGDEAIWDSLAICETLAERHPKAGLWPKDAKLRARAQSYAAEMHSGFPDLRDQLSMHFSQTLPLPELRPATEEQIARIIAAWDEALAGHAGDGGFLFGRFSVADCMYGPVVSRFTTFGVKVPARIKTYMDKVWALPGMQSWLKAAQKEVADGFSGRYPTP
jgi:glutathione S-transferase